MSEINSHCQICHRPIYYIPQNGYWKHSGTNVPRHIPQPPAHLEIKVKPLKQKVEEMEECLRELACFLGVGGYNDVGLCEFDPKIYVEKSKKPSSI